MFKLFKMLFFLLAFHFSFFFGERLQPHQVSGLMKAIFSKHVSEKTMNETIIQRSLHNYIDFFDPQGMYILERERDQWTNPGKEVIKKILLDYQRNQYPYYDKMADFLFQTIQRSRKWRKQWLQQVTKEWASIKETLPLTNENETMTVATSIRELKINQKKQFFSLLSQYLQRVEEQNNSVEEQMNSFLFYLKKIDEFEDQFLFSPHHSKELEEKQREEKQHQSTLYLLKALSQSLDSHTTFFSKEEMERMRTELEKHFKGIGVVLKEDVQGVQIVRLIEGGSAQETGKIQPGDWVIAIDNQPIHFLSLKEVIQRLHGEEKTAVNITIKREREEQKPPQILTVTVERRSIRLKNNRIQTEYEKTEGGIIGKIKLFSFYENKNESSTNDMIRAIEEFKKQGTLKGLILDLRDNPGGFLGQAVKVGGLFLSSGVVAVAEYQNQVKHVFRDLDGYDYFNGPIVILISKTSASAAEIVAQTLQDYGKAIVVGSRRSFGKGSIQQQNFTQKGASTFFKVTVGRFYTASGRSTQMDGVHSDIIVPGKWYHSEIGERYLPFALTSRKLSPYYYDTLEDVPPQYRIWFMKHYLPQLQAPSSFWIENLPLLKERSHRRLVSNSILQQFLQRNFNEKSTQQWKQRIEKEQMKEAVSILKDMIELRKEEKGIFESTPVVTRGKSPFSS